VRSCPICGRDNQSQPLLEYSLAPWELKRCVGCGLVYLVNPPEYASLQDERAWEKSWAEEDTKHRLRNPALYHIGRRLQAIPRRLFRRDKLGAWIRRFVAPGPVLDVGCGGGEGLERLPLHFIPFGVEVSKALARMAESRFARRDGRVVQGDAFSSMVQFAPEFFSGVIMISYLEHEVSPRQALASACTLMRPGARLIVKVPNLSSWNRTIRGAHWCGFRYPDHVNYFTPSLLALLLHDTGFRIVRFGLADHFPTSDNMWAVAEKP
jgi:SAM-dependent methyltransferase